MERYLDQEGVYARPDFMEETDEVTVVGVLKSFHNVHRADRKTAQEIISKALRKGHRLPRLQHHDVEGIQQLAMRAAQALVMTNTYKKNRAKMIEYIERVNISAGRKPGLCNALVCRS